MENPMSWGDLEKTIDRAMEDWHEGQLAGRVGGSQVMCIATALREAGFVKERENHD